MNTVEDSVALLVKTAETMTKYRQSLEQWRSSMTDLAILHSLEAMVENEEEYDIMTSASPRELMASIIRDRWQPVSIDDDGYEGIDNAVRTYLIDNRLAFSTTEPPVCTCETKPCLCEDEWQAALASR